MLSTLEAIQGNGQRISLIERTASNRVSDKPKWFQYWILAESLSIGGDPSFKSMMFHPIP